MDQRRLYHLALLQVPGIGHSTLKTLISYCGSAEAVFKTPVGKLMKIPGIGEVTARAVHRIDPTEAATVELQRAEQQGVSLLIHTDSGYPVRLKQIYDAPALLYHRGATDFDVPHSIAIVGTRKATDYGKRIAWQIVEALSPYRPLIVSGLAYGIDIEAHRAALEYGLPTVGVMASGIDLVYPAAHKNTAAKMVKTGGLLTEYPFGSKPDAPKFPARNRIIAGLADVVLVVEAAESGGALITARLGMDYNREVFAVPGNLNQPYSIGCLQLIRQQVAQIFTSVPEMAQALGWDGKAAKPKPPLDLTLFNSEAQKLIRLLQAEVEGMLLDDLSWKSQIPVHRVMSTLLELEFQGVIKSLPGKKFRLE